MRKFTVARSPIHSQRQLVRIILTFLVAFSSLHAQVTTPIPAEPVPHDPGLLRGSPAVAQRENVPVRTATIPLDTKPVIAAKRAIVIDAASGRVLYEKNADQKCAVASTQKVLTALCAIDKGNLNKWVKIAKTDTYVEPTKIYVRPGETYRRKALVKALLVKSGNDIARTLARDNAGSQVKFRKVMNAKAKALGMRNSHFLNAHGLTEKGQYSTARDMSKLARYALRYKFVRDCISTKEYTFYYSDGRRKKLKNTNKILRRLPYCTGMKTGTTRASGRCLICTGTLGGRTAIAVVLGSTSKEIWNDSEALLKWALERPAAAR